MNTTTNKEDLLFDSAERLTSNPGHTGRLKRQWKYVSLMLDIRPFDWRLYFAKSPVCHDVRVHFGPIEVTLYLPK